MLDLFAVDNALEAFIKQNQLSNEHFVSRYYERHVRDNTQYNFLHNKEIVENSEECIKALEKINLIVKNIKRKEILHDLLTLPLRDKIFIIYWHSKHFFTKCLKGEENGEK